MRLQTMDKSMKVRAMTDSADDRPLGMLVMSARVCCQSLRCVPHYCYCLPLLALFSVVSPGFPSFFELCLFLSSSTTNRPRAVDTSAIFIFFSALLNEFLLSFHPCRYNTCGFPDWRIETTSSSGLEIYSHLHRSRAYVPVGSLPMSLLRVLGPLCSPG